MDSNIQIVLMPWLETDYIKGNILYRGADTHSVIIEVEAQLDLITTLYVPGDMAHISGYGKIWELSPDLKWIPLGDIPQSQG